MSEETIDTLVILVPVLHRPHRVGPLLESIFATTSVATRVLFICDPDDAEEKREVVRRMQRAGYPLQWVDLLNLAGNYAGKINAGVSYTNEPVTNGGQEGRFVENSFIFVGADDLHFHPGWFEAAKTRMSETVGCVGTQDLCNRRVIRGEHATHFLLARWYAEQPCIDGSPGPLFEGYEHEFTDDELIGTARKRGAYAFAGDAVVEHLHPDAGKAPRDALYDAQGERMARSRPLYDERRRLWE